MTSGSESTLNANEIKKEAEMIMNSLHEFTTSDMTQCNKFVENRTSHFEILVC